MVLVNMASFVTGVIIKRRSQPPRTNPIAPVLGVYAQTAAEILERDGQGALSSYLDRVERASRIHAVVLNESGEEVSGRPVPAGASELAKRTTESAPFVFELSPQQPQPLAAQAVRAPSGTRYTMVAEMPGPDFPRPPPRPGEHGSLLFGLHLLGQSMLTVLLVGGLFCYWLARYVTTPIVKLRDTTHELAAGNLTARISHKLLKRRDEIGLLGRDFNLMAGRIESLVEAQRRLLGDISHELRSPLARQGVALGLARRRSGPEAASALDRIAREGERINELIGQLLALSRIESGTDGLENVRVDLSALVREVAEDADFEARSHDRSVQIIEDEPLQMVGVPELIRSAIENVVRNAIRHTEKHTQVELSLASESLNGGDRWSAILVRDQGRA